MTSQTPQGASTNEATFPASDRARITTSRSSPHPAERVRAARHPGQAPACPKQPAQGRQRLAGQGRPQAVAQQCHVVKRLPVLSRIYGGVAGA
jgi:hypothetical protein